MARQFKQYGRQKRKEQIITQLRIWNENGYATKATSYKLAKALEMSPGGTFLHILNEMVADGDLLVEERDQSGRWTTKFYLLATSPLITEKYHRRSISVKKRGVAVGQLEMFS